jgi:hypothetical protein
LNTLDYSELVQGQETANKTVYYHYGTLPDTNLNYTFVASAAGVFIFSGYSLEYQTQLTSYLPVFQV